MKPDYSNNENYQILNSFAKKTNRKLEFKEESYNSSRSARFPMHRTEAYISNNGSESSYFICFYDSMYRENEHSVYSGTFVPVSVPASAKFTVRKRFFLDNINLFSKKKTYKTGNREFDSKVVIQGNNNTYLAKYLGDIKIQKIILETFNISQTIQISLNEIPNDFVPDLKDKSQIGIYNIQQWLMEENEINKLFELIEELHRSFS
jgi:hypothetical protein